jgi:hypothetical protein
MGVGGQCHAPATVALGKTRCPLYRRLGGPQGWSVLNLAPLGFNPWTIRPAASHYTD